MLRVTILGATGYSGEELIRLLLRHPQVRITALGSSGTKQEGPVPVVTPGVERTNYWELPDYQFPDLNTLPDPPADAAGVEGV